MKRFILLIATLTCICATGVEAQVVTQEYNRSSISIVAFERGGGKEASKILSKFYPGDKYDINEIPTKTIAISKRLLDSSKKDAEELFPNTEYYEEYIAKYNFADEILSYMFNRKADGTMDDRRLRQRGVYNATDQDVLNANATAIGPEMLAESGYKLIQSAYVLFFDCKTLYSKYYESFYSVHATTKGLIYKLDISQEDIYELFKSTWIYQEDSESVKAGKRAAWNKITSGMKLKYIKSVVGGGDTHEKDPDSIRQPLEDSAKMIVDQIGATVSDLQVATVIYDTRPLRAKIGEKEGLKKKQLFRTYSYREDADGNVVSKPQGYIRATKIADNRHISRGNTASSEFYQISGLQNVQQGWTIKALPTGGLGVGLDLYYDPEHRIRPRLNLDYLVSLSTNGGALFFLGCFDPSQLFDRNDAGMMRFGVGAGYGFIWRPIQVMPYIMGGMSGFSEGLRDEPEVCYYAEPGIRLTINITYPIQVYGGASYYYQLPLRSERYNEKITEYTERTGITFNNGPVFYLGVKYNL